MQRRNAWERQTLAKGGGMTKAEISLACGCDAEKGVLGDRDAERKRKSEWLKFEFDPWKTSKQRRVN